MTDNPGITMVALPYVSKQGFTGATVQSLIIGMTERGFNYCRFFFLGDHTQVSARNAACEEALNTGAEWLWFIDSDMDFPPDTLEKLKACDADIACTDMWSRNPPSFRTVMKMGKKNSEGMSSASPISDDIAKKGEIEDIDICGMACTLIRVSLLRKLRDEGFGDPFFWSAKHGEDATFCFNAREMGARIRCNFGVVAGHWGVTRMAGQDWSRDARNQIMRLSNPEMMKRMGATHLTQEGVK